MGGIGSARFRRSSPKSRSTATAMPKAKSAGPITPMMLNPVNMRIGIWSSGLGACDGSPPSEVKNT